LSLEQLYISHLVKGLTKDEKQAMVKMMTDEFIASMSPQERKEMVKIVLPDIVQRLMTGTTISDRKELAESIMTLLMSQTGEAKNAHEKKENRPR
jgi:hypothetical protein